MIEMNDQMWPIVFIKWEVDSTNCNLEAYLDKYEKILKKKSPYIAIINIEKAPRDVPIGYKKRLLREHEDWLKQNEATIKKTCLGTVYITKTLKGRAAMKARLRLRPMPFYSVVVSTMEEALNWARERLESEGLRPTFQLEAVV